MTNNLLFGGIGQPAPRTILEGDFTSWTLDWNVEDPGGGATSDFYIDVDGEIVGYISSSTWIALALGDGATVTNQAGFNAFLNEKKVGSILNKYVVGVGADTKDLLIMKEGVLIQTIDIDVVLSEVGDFNNRRIGISPNGQFIVGQVVQTTLPVERICLFGGA